MDAAVEQLPNAYERSLIYHVILVRAACEKASYPRFFERPYELDRPLDRKAVGRERAAFEPSLPVGYPYFEPAQIFLFIFARVNVLPAAANDRLVKRDALEYGLLARQAVDKFGHLFAYAVLALASAERLYDLAEIGNHDLLPALADKAYRAVEIEQGAFEARAGVFFYCFN